MFLLGMSFLSFWGCNESTEKDDEVNLEPTQEPGSDPSDPSTEPSEPAQEPSTDPNSEDNDGDGFSENDGDCNDEDIYISPNAADYTGDGIDQDCDGDDYTWGLCDDSCEYAMDGACDDSGPGATFSACELGTDCSDCGPRNDWDGDGYYEGDNDPNPDDDESYDCDDDDADINPGAEEVIDDGIDQDCDGEDLESMCSNTCSSSNNGVCEDGGSYSTAESCYLGTDCSDCGARFDLDGDGYDSEQDCDDLDPTSTPDSEDFCNGLDENCNGVIDEDYDTDEPTDANSPVFIGDLDDGARSDSGYITHEGDIDGFTVYSHDGWLSTPDFTCSITVPQQVDISVVMFAPDGTEVDSATINAGTTETVTFDPSFFNITNNSGNYLLVLSSDSGSSCEEYTLTCYSD